MIDPAVYGFTNPMVERLPLSGRKETAPARESYTPPQTGDKPTGAVWHKSYSLMEDAPKAPQVNTYDVWSRKDAPPARNSYTPPPLEEGTKPTPAPWNKAYLLSQDLPQHIPPTLSTYNIWDRKDGPPAREAYTPPSGQKPPVWYPAYAQGITKAELDKLILNDQDRSDKPYDYNGVANKASKNYRALSQYADTSTGVGGEGGWLDHLSSFNHHQGNWVDSKKVDERVEEFVNRNVHEGLDLNWPRSDTAMESNGLKNPASGYGYVDPDAIVPPALYQRHHRNYNHNNDISEKMIDEEVHGFANPNTETLNWSRSED